MRRFIIILLSISSTLAMAQGPKKEAGWHTKVSLIALVSEEKSNFDTDNKVKADPLNSSPDSDSDTSIFPNVEASYVFGDNNEQEFSIGGKAKAGPIPFGIEFGFTRHFSPRSSFTIAASPGIISGDTFSDPFIADVEREETDVTSKNVRAEFKGVGGSPFSFELNYFDRKVDDEKSGTDFLGSASDQLDRNGQGFEGKVSTMVPLGDGGLFGGIGVNFGRFSADGEAMSYDKKALEFSARKRIERHIISGTLGLEVLEYDGRHTVFNDILEEEGLSLSAQYIYSGLLDNDQLGFVSRLSYSDTSANIDFYDEEVLSLVLGVSYQL